jgi:hypothetical protein
MVLSQRLPRGAEEHHEESKFRFERSTSRIRVKGVIATLTRKGDMIVLWSRVLGQVYKEVEINISINSDQVLPCALFSS